MDFAAGAEGPEPPRRRTTPAVATAAIWDIAADPRWMLLTSCRRYVTTCSVLRDPSIAVLAADDAVWQIATADWAARRPRRWRLRSYREWIDESDRLEGKRCRLAELATQVQTFAAPRGRGTVKRATLR